MRRRLFTGIANLAIAGEFRRPKNPGAPRPTEGDGALVRLYVFARSSEEAERSFRVALTSARYTTLEVSKVQPNGSNRPWPLDERYICSADFVRSRISGEVVFGRFTGYENTEPTGSS
jgi:hypothetical protein